tara:strand:- start:193 stop:465 length:273 start_codon:yes stop_codon:yes gene_type:complete
MANKKTKPKKKIAVKTYGQKGTTSKLKTLNVKGRDVAVLDYPNLDTAKAKRGVKKAGTAAVKRLNTAKKEASKRRAAVTKKRKAVRRKGK